MTLESNESYNNGLFFHFYTSFGIFISSKCAKQWLNLTLDIQLSWHLHSKQHVQQTKTEAKSVDRTQKPWHHGSWRSWWSRMCFHRAHVSFVCLFSGDYIHRLNCPGRGVSYFMPPNLILSRIFNLREQNHYEGLIHLCSVVLLCIFINGAKILVTFNPFSSLIIK